MPEWFALTPRTAKAPVTTRYLADAHLESHDSLGVLTHGDGGHGYAPRLAPVRQPRRLNLLGLPRSRLTRVTISCAEMFALTDGTSKGDAGVRSGTSA